MSQEAGAAAIAHPHTLPSPASSAQPPVPAGRGHGFRKCASCDQSARPKRRTCMSPACLAAVWARGGVNLKARAAAIDDPYAAEWEHRVARLVAAGKPRAWAEDVTAERMLEEWQSR